MTDEATTPPGDAVHAARPMRSQGAKLGETAQVTQEQGRGTRADNKAPTQEGSGLADALRQGLSDQVELRKNGIADRLSAVAARAQRSAGDLRRDEPWLGELVGRGAEELDALALELRHNDVGDLMGSVETFARRQPALFMGATVALGYALTRFVGAGAWHEPADRYPPADPASTGPGWSGY